MPVSDLIPVPNSQSLRPWSSGTVSGSFATKLDIKRLAPNPALVSPSLTRCLDMVIRLLLVTANLPIMKRLIYPLE